MLHNILKRKSCSQKAAEWKKGTCMGNMSLFDFQLKGLQIAFVLTLITLLNINFIK